MKNLKVVIIAVVCVAAICTAFFFFTESLGGGEGDLTEIEKVLTKDLDNNYPKTPREVVKFYNRIVACYHNEATKEEQLEDLVDQMMKLFDADFKKELSREQYLSSVQSDVTLYKSIKRSIASMTVCDSNDVVYKTDERNGDKIAFVDTDYFVNTNGTFTNSYLRIGLKQDAEGQWHIIGVTLREGAASDDE